MSAECKIAQQQREERLIKIQLDLALSLNEQRELDKALELCLDAALKASHTDCGAIYLYNSTNGNLEMRSYRGLSPDFVRGVLIYGPESDNFQIVQEGRPVYARYDQLGLPLKKTDVDEHLLGVAVIPFFNKAEVIGCLNVASHTLEELPAESRSALETIAAQIGSALTRLQTEQSLERTRREWENIFQAIGQPTLILDAEHNVISANRAAQRATGKKERELVAKKCYQIFHEADSPVERCPLVAILESGRFETVEKTLEVLGGLYLVSCTPVLDEKGDLERIIHIATDITRRKRAERALQESEERFRTIFEGATDGILAAEIDTGKFVFANPRICEITGYSAVELMCMDVSQIHPSAELQHVYEAFNKQSRREIMTARDIPVLRRDQTVVYCDISTKVMTIGSRDYQVGFFQDITERRRSEEALRESEAKYRAIFENATESIILVDPETTEVVEFNDMAHKALGYTRAEFQKIRIQDFEASESVAEITKHTDKVLEQGFDSFRTKHRTKDGQIQDVRASLRTVSIREKVFVLSMWTDITEQIRATEELKYRGRMESLITRLSARFINLKSEQIDKEINRALRELGEFIGVDRSYVFLFSPDGTQLSNTHEWCAEGIEPQINHLQNFPVDDFPWICKKIKAGEVVHIPRVADLPPEATCEKKEFEAQAIQSLIVLSMPISEKINGFVGFDSVCEEKTWSEDIISLSKVVGTIFANALECKQTEERIQVYQKQLHSLASELLLTEDHQRQQIANDLHENIGQILALLKIKMGMLREATDPARTSQMLEETDRALEQALNFTQSLTYELCPPILFEMGLEAALEWLLEQNQKEHGLEYRFEHDHKKRRLHKDLSSFLFRAVRELLINVIKHARTDKVRVALYQNHHYLSILVEDYGVGFDTNGTALIAKGDGGFGLFSIRERLLHLGGRMKINTTAGSGTSVTIRLPLTKPNLP